MTKTQLKAEIVKLTALLDQATAPGTPAIVPAPRKVGRPRKVSADRPQNPPTASGFADPRLGETPVKAQWDRAYKLLGRKLAWDPNMRLSEYRKACEAHQAQGGRWAFPTALNAMYKLAKNADGTFNATPAQALKQAPRMVAQVAPTVAPVAPNVYDRAFVAQLIAQVTQNVIASIAPRA